MRQIMIGESGLGVAAAWSRHPGASHLRGKFRPMDIRRRARRGRFASTMGVIPIANPDAYTLGDRWSAAMPPDQNLEGIGKFVKKLKKKLPLKKLIKYGAIGAAVYFSAGAALPLLSKLKSGGGVKLPKIPKEIAGLARDAITGRVVDMAPTAPGSYGYYDSRGMLPGQSDPYYTPSGYGGDAYSALQPWEQPDQGGGVQEAGIAGMSPKTLLIAGGVVAAVFLMSRGGGSRRRR